MHIEIELSDVQNVLTRRTFCTVVFLSAQQDGFRNAVRMKRELPSVTILLLFSANCILSQLM